MQINTKFDINKKYYLIREEYEQVRCRFCHKDHSKNTGWHVVPDLHELIGIEIYFHRICYVFGHNPKWKFNEEDDSIFLTKEEAEIECNRRNAKR